MANFYVACWTMSEQAFGGTTAKARAADLTNVALAADTQLKIMGRAAGGAFTRMLVVPEYFFTDAGALVSRSDKHSIYRKLQQISAQVPDLLIIAGTIAYGKGLFSKDTYNVCPALMGGQIIKKLYKSNNDGVYQVNGTFTTKNDNGKGVPLLTVNGISIGLDICMDYNDDRLGTHLQATGAPAPDIHVQISGTNAMGTPSAKARVNGVYIHCDLGGKGANGATAWRITAQNGAMGAATTRIQPTLTLQPGIGRIMFFDSSV